MKKTLFVLGALFTGAFLYAQQFNYGWHRSIPVDPDYGTPSYEQSALFGDTLYLLGEMSGADSVDLDPTAGEDWIYDESTLGVSKLIFVSKYLVSDGSYLESHKLVEYPTSSSSGVYVYDLAVDQTGRLIIVGYSGTGIDFDPSAVSAGWYGSTGSGNFASFYYANGSYMSHLEYDHEESGWTIIRDLYIRQAIVDESNNLYLVGNYYGTVDFDFTAGTENHTSMGEYDACVIKVNLTAQSYEWGVGFGSSLDEDAQYACYSNNRLNLYGTFDGPSIDLDPGVGTDNHPQPMPHSCTFINQLDAAGNQTNGFVLGAPYMYGMAADPQGNVYLLAECNDAEMIDMDPGPATHNLNVANSYPMAVAKYDNGLNYLWSRSITGNLGNHDVRTIAATDSYVSVSGYNFNELYLSSETDTDTIPMPADGEYFITMLKSGSGDLIEYNSFPFLPASFAEGSTQIATLNEELISTGSFQYKMDFHCYDGMTEYDSTAFDGFGYAYNPFILKLNYLGFSELEASDPSNGIQVYPNPATTDLRIECTEGLKRIQIQDITGRLVYSGSFSGATTAEIEVAGFEEGLYVLMIEDQKLRVSVQRFVKNR